MTKYFKLIVCMFFVYSAHAQAEAPPAVTGLTLEGNTFSWNPQEEAVGYNIYSGFRYFDTVTTGNSYELSAPGRYTVVSFNENSEFSPFPPPADGESTTFVVYTGTASSSIRYDLLGTNLYVYLTCTDVGPGDTCAARCPVNYTSNSGRDLFLINATGGACSTSDIVEADALVLPIGYNCTVPTFSGEVLAQAVCAYR